MPPAALNTQSSVLDEPTTKLTPGEMWHDRVPTSVRPWACAGAAAASIKRLVAARPDKAKALRMDGSFDRDCSTKETPARSLTAAARLKARPRVGQREVKKGGWAADPRLFLPIAGGVRPNLFKHLGRRFPVFTGNLQAAAQIPQQNQRPAPQKSADNRGCPEGQRWRCFTGVSRASRDPPRCFTACFTTTNGPTLWHENARHGGADRAQIFTIRLIPYPSGPVNKETRASRRVTRRR